MKLTLSDWQKTYKPKEDLIVQASSMAADDGWRPWTIGMSWQYVLNHHKNEKIQQGEHNNTVLCAVTTTTDKRRRPFGKNRVGIVNTLSKNGIHNRLIDHEKYFDTLPSYKFVISPEGNGIDCHRHYEALIAGTIPIIERNPLMEEKYKGCPILWTDDYSEITTSYLEQKYDEMVSQEYDFSRLFLSYYDTETQKKIKESGNYWLNRIHYIGRSWYFD
jgi:hypothetical protein